MNRVDGVVLALLALADLAILVYLRRRRARRLRVRRMYRNLAYAIRAGNASMVFKAPEKVGGPRRLA